jgi:hypothetical protein
MWHWYLSDLVNLRSTVSRDSSLTLSLRILEVSGLNLAPDVCYHGCDFHNLLQKKNIRQQIAKE